MGIFNEHSSNQHQFAKGIQGAPGVGFNLTSTGDYDMVNKKLRNVGNPASTPMLLPRSMLMKILVVEKHHY